MGGAINRARGVLRGVWSTSPIRAAALLFIAYLVWKHWGRHVETYLRDATSEVIE